jgi:hypothetical protein
LPFRKGGYVHQNGWLLREGTEEFLGRAVPLYADIWTPEMRKKTVEVLRSTQDRDREALKLLQQATDSQQPGRSDAEDRAPHP